MTAADLTGRAMPSLSLPSTLGGFVDPSLVVGAAVFMVYPHTGKPGIPDPAGWDHIVGAHGSTPQLLAYKALHQEFEKRGISLWGVSLNSPMWQAEFGHRTGLPFALLSDEFCKLTAALQLDAFAAGERQFLRRRTLIVRSGVIVHDRRHMEQPVEDASAVFTSLHESGA